jgi:hypothetical protein
MAVTAKGLNDVSNVSAGNVRVTCVTGKTLPSSDELSGADQVWEKTVMLQLSSAGRD